MNMPVSAERSLAIILIVAAVTFATRAFPFILFPKGRQIPDLVSYLGKVLTPAVIGMLVVYCLRSTRVLSAPFGLPELISVLLVVILHVWKRNTLLSISVGTVCYMFLIQKIFT